MTQANLQLKEAATDKINTMQNRAEAAYYKDNVCITTIRSLVGTTIIGSICTQTATDQSETITAPHIHNDNLSISISITMESFTNLQIRVITQDLKLNHINLLLGHRAEVVLKGDKRVANLRHPKRLMMPERTIVPTTTGCRGSRRV